MEITKQCVVALTWTLKDTLGEELDVLDEPVEFLVGGNDLLEKVQEALQGHQAGDKLDLHLEPEEAFGDFNDQLIFLEPRANFPKELEEGLTFEGSALPADSNPDMPKDAIYVVTGIYPESDCNLKKPEPQVPVPISSRVASRTPITFKCRRMAMPARGWLPSRTTCSG